RHGLVADQQRAGAARGLLHQLAEARADATGNAGAAEQVRDQPGIAPDRRMDQDAVLEVGITHHDAASSPWFSWSDRMVGTPVRMPWKLLSTGPTTRPWRVMSNLRSVVSCRLPRFLNTETAFWTAPCASK